MTRKSISDPSRTLASSTTAFKGSTGASLPEGNLDQLTAAVAECHASFVNKPAMGAVARFGAASDAIIHSNVASKATAREKN